MVKSRKSALEYGLTDLDRIEQMTLRSIAESCFQLDISELQLAKRELIDKDLIAYDGHLYQLLSLPKASTQTGQQLDIFSSFPFGHADLLQRVFNPILSVHLIGGTPIPASPTLELNKKTTELIYEPATFSPSLIPKSGNKTSGSNEVAAKGTASVIHHIAIKAAIAAINIALEFCWVNCPTK